MVKARSRFSSVLRVADPLSGTNSAIKIKLMKVAMITRVRRNVKIAELCTRWRKFRILKGTLSASRSLSRLLHAKLKAVLASSMNWSCSFKVVKRTHTLCQTLQSATLTKTAKVHHKINNT